MNPDNSKIEAIINIPKPNDKTDLQRFLGLVTYISKFVENLSEKTAPLRLLLKNDEEFIWESIHDRAFNNSKICLSKYPCLSFFNVNEPVVLSVDASKNGLGATLMQNKKPCAHASRALTTTQSNYAQIEKKLLAVLFGWERFHQYVYGKRFCVETDHKPLISIIKKPIAQCPARLQRMLVQLRKYDFELYTNRVKN